MEGRGEGMGHGREGDRKKEGRNECIIEDKGRKEAGEI